MQAVAESLGLPIHHFSFFSFKFVTGLVRFTRIYTRNQIHMVVSLFRIECYFSILQLQFGGTTCPGANQSSNHGLSEFGELMVKSSSTEEYMEEAKTQKIIIINGFACRISLSMDDTNYMI